MKLKRLLGIDSRLIPVFCSDDCRYPFTTRCTKELAKLKQSLTEEGIAVDILDNWFLEGLKVLYASCFVDQYLNLDTATNFQRTLAILEAEVRDRDAHIQVVLKRFETFPPVTESTTLTSYRAQSEF